MKLEFMVTQLSAGMKLGNFLRMHRASASLIRSVKFMQGGLLVDEKQAFTNMVLSEGQRVTMQLPKEESFSVLPQGDMPVNIIYETAHVMLIDKPAGVVVHPTRTHSKNTLANAFCGLMEKRGTITAFRPIGRLDADTSGLVMCAMNPFAAPILGKNAKKTYIALAMGRLPLGKGQIEGGISQKPGSVIEQMVAQDGKPSLTNYEVLAASGEASLVVVRPLTGRTHQIRVHFAHIGHALHGDDLYAGKREFIDRHALHCALSVFSEPEKGGQRVASAFPEDMQKAAKATGVFLPPKDLYSALAQTCTNEEKRV